MFYFQRATWCGGDNSPVKQFQNSPGEQSAAPAPQSGLKTNKQKKTKTKDFKGISRIDYTKPAWKTKGKISEVAWKWGPHPEGGFKHHRAVPYLCISQCLSKDLCATCTWFWPDLRICHSQAHRPAITSQQQWGASFRTFLRVMKTNKCILKWMSSLKGSEIR